jgi:lysophospholipase L1-like esterase
MGVLDAPSAFTWPRDVAARVLAAEANAIDLSTTTPAADTPVVTLSAASGQGSVSPGTAPITSGVLRPMTRIAPFASPDSGGQVDVDRCLYYELLGRPTMHWGTTYPQYHVADCDYLTGGSAQNARWLPMIRFSYTGAVFALRVRIIASPFYYRLRVNGRYVTTAVQAPTGTVNSLYDLVVTFTGSDWRDIEIELLTSTASIGGIWVEPTQTIRRLAPPRFTLQGFGDSITGGATGASNRLDTWVRHAADRLGGRYVNTAIGGSGYTIAPTFTSRRADIAQAKSDVIVVFGGYNDSVTSAATTQAAAETFLPLVVADNPRSLVIVAGPWIRKQTFDQGLYDTNNALRTVAGNLGLPYIDLASPYGDFNNYSLWVSGTTYGAGDIVRTGGVIYLCLHRTNGTTNPSTATGFWVPIGFVTGTGFSGSTTGSGNGDTVVSSDGIHPTTSGSHTLGNYMAAEISNICRQLLVA